MTKPREFPWSSEDRATYAAWRRRMLIFYGGVAVAASIAAYLLR
jgi:hypothetical protein